MEKIDLVDATGKIVKVGVARNGVTALDEVGLYAQIVIVVVVNRAGNIVFHQRSNKKNTQRGCIDHVCGMVQSGEDALDAADREIREEIGITHSVLRLVCKGVNVYGRYRYLYVSRTDQSPMIMSPDEVSWVGCRSREDLDKMRASNYKFVKDFFEDLDAAIECLGDRSLAW